MCNPKIFRLDLEFSKIYAESPATCRGEFHCLRTLPLLAYDVIEESAPTDYRLEQEGETADDSEFDQVCSARR